jgi:hypothetical protein
MILLFVKLCLGHLIGDWVIQTRFIAAAKDPHNKINASTTYWPYALAAHAATQAVIMGWITGLWQVGIVEFGSHFVVDMLKCFKITNLHADQAIHALFLVGYALYVAQISAEMNHMFPA